MRRLPKIIKHSKEDKEALKKWNKKQLGTNKTKKRKQRVRDIPRSYATYIKSNFWKNRKNQFWKNHKKQCVACISTKYVELHHALYSGFDGTEKDHHLFALCKICHKEFHDTYGSSKDMLDQTMVFIIVKQSGYPQV